MCKDKKILVVDDDYAVVKMVSGLIETIGCHAVTACDGEEALDKISTEKPDIIIVDWQMPRMDGWEFCRKIRNNKETAKIPVIMLTAKNDPEDEIIGLEAGVDDYITKPFNTDVFLARIKAICRRYSSEPENEIAAAGICVNTEKHEVIIDNCKVELWPKEFELLRFLMNKKGSVVTRDTMLEQVWGYEYMGTTRAVDATVKRLREKMGTKADNIVTVKGVGYKFIG